MFLPDPERLLLLLQNIARYSNRQYFVQFLALHHPYNDRGQISSTVGAWPLCTRLCT